MKSVLCPWLSPNSSAFLTGMGVGSFGVQAGPLSAFGLWPLAVATCTHPKKSPTQCIMESFYLHAFDLPSRMAPFALSRIKTCMNMKVSELSSSHASLAKGHNSCSARARDRHRSHHSPGHMLHAYTVMHVIMCTCIHGFWGGPQKQSLETTASKAAHLAGALREDAFGLKALNACYRVHMHAIRFGKDNLRKKCSK